MDARSQWSLAMVKWGCPSESSSLEQLIQEIKIYQGEETVVFSKSRATTASAADE